MDCVSEETLRDLTTGIIRDDASLRAFAEHFADCEECAERYLKASASLHPILNAASSEKTEQSPTKAQSGDDTPARRQLQNMGAFRKFGETPAAAPLSQLWDDHWPPPESLLNCGRWQFLDVIGSGGMGTVYLAEDVENDHAYRAVKVLQPLHQNRRQLEMRFRREGEILLQMPPHRNIVRVIESDTIDNWQVLVLEFIPGADLDQLLRAVPDSRLPFQQAVALIVQTLAGINHAWNECQLIHRDLKPANLMLTPEGVVKILDFGLARLRDPDVASDQTRTGFAAGTPTYASPEQDKDFQSVDVRSDIYSIGCTLFRMIAGRPVFGAETGHQNSLDIRTAHHQIAPPTLHHLVPDVPKALSRVVACFLAKAPDDRPANPAEAAAMLWPFLTPNDQMFLKADFPLAESRSIELRKVARRKVTQRVLRMVAGGLLVVSLLLTLRSTWLRGPSTPVSVSDVSRERISNDSSVSALKTAPAESVQSTAAEFVEAESTATALPSTSAERPSETRSTKTSEEPALADSSSSNTSVTVVTDPVSSIAPEQRGIQVAQNGLDNDLKIRSTQPADGNTIRVVQEGNNNRIDISTGGPPGQKDGEGSTASAASGSVPVANVSRQPNGNWPEDAPDIAVAPFDELTAKRLQEEWAAYLKIPVEYSQSVGGRMRLLPPGRFLMGAPETELSRDISESPRHSLSLTNPMYVEVYEVTQWEYLAVSGDSDAAFSATGPQQDILNGIDANQFPQESVSWYRAVMFCNRLSELDGLSPYYEISDVDRIDRHVRRANVIELHNDGYRLPTEAEWEYACRAGTETPFHFGSLLNGTQANVDGLAPYGTDEKGPSLQRPATVGSYPPNAFGLHDMNGNVREWCWDRYARNYYDSSPDVNPRGPDDGAERSFRGGAWSDLPMYCRTAFRFRFPPSDAYNYLGIRIVRTP